jgi:uncharacterized membrane protein YecN with MAPEG domain
MPVLTPFTLKKRRILTADAKEFIACLLILLAVLALVSAGPWFPWLNLIALAVIFRAAVSVIGPKRRAGR